MEDAARKLAEQERRARENINAGGEGIDEIMRQYADKKQRAREPKQRGAWADGAQVTAEGALKKNAHNAHLFFRIHPEFKDKLRFNEFTREVMVFGGLPWEPDNGKPLAWRDIDGINAQAFAHTSMLEISKDMTHDAVTASAFANKFHPVKDYLNGLVWDGIERLSYWLSDFLGVPRSDYSVAVARAWMISLVARIMEAGCKVDAMLILEGLQGILKSTLLRIIGGEWFTDELAEIGSKDASEQVRGRWLIELAELEQMSRAETTRIKAFISRSEDRFRVSYGRNVESFPRTCVFAGTTNADGGYFKDDTGNRRYWPVRCCSDGDMKRIDVAGFAAVRDQLFAEAVVAYRAGEKWYLSEELERAAAEEQSLRVESDPWHEVVAEWCESEGDSLIKSSDILIECLHKKLDELTRQDDRRVGSILRKLG